MIKPTVGRVVWFWPTRHNMRSHSVLDANQPFDAHVVYVHGDREINVAGFDHDGNHFTDKNVPLWEPGEDIPPHSHWQWMPYQKGQAAKTEQLETRLGSVEQGFTKP